VRLRRLRPDALVKEDARQLLVPLGPDERPVEVLTGLLEDLVPLPAEAVEARSSG